MAKVKVQQGWLAGAIVESVTGEGKYYSFRGVPYAQPPLGKLRFKAPQPPLPWDGIRTATEHGPISFQVKFFTTGEFEGSEDCLYLNVYSADLTPTKKMPVMVFIHGGGFKYGSGNDDLYGPDFLVTQGVVLVTFNYRLETLGFLCLDTEEVPGNAGLKDQVAALQWVRDNIVNFGGDPDNVTVFGESAGGCSTSLHMISPMSKGLFKKVIPLSGVPYCDWCLPFQPRKRAFLLGKDLGIETNDPNELLEFLQSVPAEKLAATDPILLSFEDYNQNLYKLYHFTPVIEKDFGKGHFLTEDPREALRNKRISDADVLIGYAKAEAASGIPEFEKYVLERTKRYPELVVPRKLLMKSTPETVLELSDRIREFYFKGKPVQMKEFVTYAGHACFTLDILRFATHLPKVGAGKRYLYKFSYVSDRNVYGRPGLNHGIREAGHMDILMYLFHAKYHNVKVVPDSKEFKMINLVRTIFTNFAKYGNPTPDSSLGAIWPEYDNASKAYVEIQDKLVKKTAPEAEVVEFWSKIFEYAGVEF